MDSLRFHSGTFFRKSASLFLAFSFGSGFLLGLICCVKIGFEFLPFFPVREELFFSELQLLCWLAPFLLSGLAGSVCPDLLFPICFLKAFLVAFNGLLIVFCFSNYSWLLRFFLLFSEMFSVPLLYFYWLSILSEPHPFWAFRSGGILLAVLFIAFLDHLVISHFFCGMQYIF